MAMRQLFLYLNSTPKSRTRTLVLVLLASAIITFLAHLLFQSGSFQKRANNIIWLGLAGLVMYGIWLLVLYLLQRKDRIRPKDIGITTSDLVKGIWAGFYIFLSINLIFLALSYLSTNTVTLSQSFSSIRLAAEAVGIFIFNILAGAFIEEAIFRAYLLPQLYLIIHQKLKDQSTSLALAVVSSQLIFALSHLPEDVFKVTLPHNMAAYNFLQLFVGGVIHALVYLRTRNLLFVTIVHAFINFSLAIVETPVSFRVFALLVTILITIFWNRLFPAKIVLPTARHRERYAGR